MINASGPSGVSVNPAQPASVVPPVTPVRPATPAIPAAPPQSVLPPTPITSIPQAVGPATPPAPATTPSTPGNAVAGAPGGTLKPPGKKLPVKLIIGGVVLVLLLIGAIAAYFLSQTSQDVRNQASVYQSNQICTNSSDTRCVAESNGKSYLYICQTPGSPFVKKSPAEECGTTPIPTPTPTPSPTGSSSKCGPGNPKWNESTRKCGPYYLSE